MPGLVIAGKQVDVPGVVVHNYFDDPKLKLADYDGRPRKTSWVRNIILHTTVGDAQLVMPGKGPSEKWWQRYPDIWASDGKNKDGTINSKGLHGGHGVLDGDAVLGWYADALTVHAYHAGVMDNEYSVGIEIKQWGKTLYDVCFPAIKAVLDVLTARLGIQRQVHWPYSKPVPRLADGRNFVGIAGHRDLTDTRGWGDPGDAVMDYLIHHGYEAFDFAKGQDIVAWEKRQTDLNAHGAKLTVDGTPGPETCAALKAQGHTDGIWMT